MAEVKPLKLKRELVGKRSIATCSLPVAQVLVDMGIAHLSDPFDYLIAEELTNLKVGALVEVPFGARSFQGYVVSRRELTEKDSQLKFIVKVLSELAIYKGEVLELISQVSSRYACSSWDVIASAIPPRAVRIEKNYENRVLPLTAKPTGNGTVFYTQITNKDDLVRQIINIIEDSKYKGQILVIVPDQRDLIQIRERLGEHEILELGSHLDKSTRYSNYLKSVFDSPKLVIGTRSAVFTPLLPNSRIIVLDDGDESMYERRFPGWNVRDVSMMRTQSHSLQFISASPSMEITRLIDIGWIKAKNISNTAREKKAKVFFKNGNLSEISVIKDGLKKGNVLVSIGDPGYINSFSCQKCRNQAMCSCGGHLFFEAKGEQAKCSICRKSYINWKCIWCQGESIRTISKGGARFAEELGRQVPGARTIFSRGNNRIDKLPISQDNLLVIATYGCEPDGEYEAVVELSVESLVSRIGLRSSEIAIRVINNNLVRLKQGGNFYLDIEADHIFAQSLIKYDVLQACLRELEERKSVSLPPFVRIATLFGETPEIEKISRSMDKLDFQLIHSITSDTSSSGKSKLTLRVDIGESDKFSNFIHSLSRYRSLKSLSPISIRLDPYSI